MSNNYFPMYRRNQSAGFSLIEVLVSILVLSLALLGTASLTGASLKSTNTSYYRSQATILADDIFDRMRANVAAARMAEYNISAGPVYNAATGTMARYDCEEWIGTIASTLPQGTATVVVDNAGIATILIAWTSNGDEQFTTASRL